MKNLFAAIALVFTIALSAQQEIETSPDFSESPRTVEKNHFQMENRFLYQVTDDKKSNVLKPNSYWKYGLSDILEVSVRADLEFHRQIDSTSSGVKPLLVGLKMRLAYEKNFLPDAALLVQIKAPNLASSDYRVPYIAPQITLLLRKSFTNSISATYNFGAEWTGDRPDPRFNYSYGPRIKLSKKLDAFIETFGYLSQHSKPERWIDSGFMFRPISNFQLELAAGYEITHNVVFNQYFGLVGASFKI